MPIVGYPDRYSVEAGQRITFMVSSPEPHFGAEMVRLIHGDDSPDGPGFKSRPVPADVEGEHEGEPQELHGGSYVRIAHADGLDLTGSFTLQLWIRPTTPDKARQALVAKDTGGTALLLELDHGVLTLRRHAGGAGASRTLAVDRPVALHTWYFVVATFDARTGDATLRLDPLPATASELAATAHGSLTASDSGEPAGEVSDLLIGARLAPDVPGGVTDYYNGKIDAPRLYRRVLSAAELDRLRHDTDPAPVEGLVAAWDFAVEISSSIIADSSGHGYGGVAMQRPSRAVTGHNWDGSQSDWTRAHGQYGAIHFHDDDLDDAGWNPSVSWQVPEQTASGVYALHVTAGADDDYIPFVVRPGLGAPTAPILVQMPTFSYLAYGNEHLLHGPESRQMMVDLGMDPEAVAAYPSRWQDKYIIENHLNSLYDTHTDGSGVFYSSRLRPVLNMRPKYEMAGLDNGKGSPHQFNADLHLVDWLTEMGYQFDVVTDEDLYRDGPALLQGYRVVITGTHHEYWASSMLDAMRDYLLEGGRLMYLAGNGFYWVTELEPEHGHTIEIRRRGPSTRSWDAAPGEGHLSFTGELGGLWRYRNRSPQQLVGVGFTAQGTGPGRPYERQPGSFDSRAAFIFAGIGADELIGDQPSLVSSYGAAGFEIDRVDHSLGSPHRTIILATATGFSDSYQHVSEETLMSTSLEGGTVNELVRADMVLVEYPHGGAVFTPASITWCATLSYNSYRNNVSRITRNVLDRFTQDGPVFDSSTQK